MKTETFIIPDFYLPALINGDYSGLSDADAEALDRFTEEQLKHFERFWALCDTESEGFLTFHDLKPFGIGAADCSSVVFDIGGLK